ncbi:MAG: alpha-amylase family glycosyl hydrolase [Oscillochloridaceae bacterium]|nr:alpha-amylase family glycosyl hydrolase [Chloroflexaceae bacterium]MDW8392279.1 alpha-amylase family glycosyl hydrolase [Oscillochloridaceae bacterium]
MSDPRARIHTLLEAIYGQPAGAAITPRLQAMLDDFVARHPPGPPRPPAERLTENDVILITYGDQVREPDRPPLQTLGEILDTTFGGIVSGVHILPFFPYTSDDGFSVVDYRAVDPALGTWADIERLSRRYRLMFDAVVNHISASSAWFREFLAGAPGAEARFHVVDPATDLRGVTRPRTTPLLTSFETAAGVRHVWTTFSADQIDLNFANPEVLLEMTDVLLAYVEHGASLIRLDAIGYLWKEPGTTCIHLPNTHRIVQLWRAVLDVVAPDVLLITETNVPHADNISYFGDGSNEAQLVYQFPLAPLVLHAFATGDATRLSGWARELAPPSPTTAFFNFLASHDGIGVVPATGILSQAEVQDLCAQVERHGGRVSYKTNPDGSQSPYELNCTWFDALSGPAGGEAPELAIGRFLASQAIMLALQGVPGVYVHSLLGSPNYQQGLQATGRFRSLNREKWTRADLEARLADPRRREGTVLQRMARLIRARRNERAFHPNSPQQVLDVHPSVFALERRTPEGDATVLCLHNVSGAPQRAPAPAVGGARDLISGTRYPPGTDGIELAPYQAAWLRPE